MRTLFIADLHLSEDNPEITAAFFHFLDKECEDVDALYILGDLFEVWIGDDEHTPLMDEVAKRLAHCATHNNTHIYYLHGNRDFMIGKSYAKQACMQLLPEHHEIELYGQKALIMHGDTLCLADLNYQKMRKIIHNRYIQFIFNLLPLSIRKKIGWKIRTASQSKKTTNAQMMSVTQDEVIRLLKKHQLKIVIHGHTHKVAEHKFEVDGAVMQRYDVGDWYQTLSFLEAKKEQLTLIIHPINYYSL
ncbi:UDP-2,3-diacylglucosamine diphosphatase [Psychromonas sp. MME1]|uniref:UDP-2,3-diacylglucosamine diphosphatase n=1 Tax=Psychromonas sp. MME1 TaxID=3231032 RepID=UPI0034E1E3E7